MSTTCPRIGMLGIHLESNAFAPVTTGADFRTGFDEWYPDNKILEVDAAGLTSPMFERYPWKALPRPVWPLDAGTQWTPPALG